MPRPDLLHRPRLPGVWRLAPALLITGLMAACGGGSGVSGGETASPPAAAAGPGAAAADSRATAASALDPRAATVLRWSDPATWGGTLPGADASVVVPAGKTIVLDGVTPALRTLTIEGTLLADPARDVAITADAVFVRGGRLAIGTADQPYTRRATITLTGSSTADAPGLAGFGTKVLAQMGGSIELHGLPLVGWTRLDGADVAAGARRITLAEAPGWRVGDRIVIATSSKNQDHHDVAQIAAIDGRSVELAAPLRWPHFGSARSVGGRTVDVRAAVGLLSRNIVVQGDANSEALKIGGHAMFMAGAQGAAVRIAGVEFTRMGQLDVAGRYPLHFHVMEARCHGCYVRDSSVHTTVQRGLVLHDTQGVTVAGNVLFNTVGHNLVVESHVTTGNVIDRNLALVNRQPVPAHTDPVLVSQNDRLPANFWLRGAKNQVTGNVAAGSQSSGFNYDGINGDPIDFRGNTAHAAMGESRLGEGEFDTHGGLLVLTEAERPATDRMSDFLAFHNAFGLWPEENGVSRVERFVAAENGIAIFGRGVGNRMHFKDGLIVGRLPGSSAAPGQPLAYTYGSDTVLENITFAGYASLGFSAGDSAPTQSSLTFVNASFVGARPPIWLGDMVRYLALDDTMLPRGYYVTRESPWLASPECSLAVTNPADADISTYYRCPRELTVAELAIRSGANGGYNGVVNPYLVRSDGLRYRQDRSDDTGMGSGAHGTTVITNAPMSYRIDQAPSGNGWAVRLSTEAVPQADADNRAGRLLVNVAIPAQALPRGVFRTGTRFERPNPPTAAQAMRPASSLADWEANPLSTYLHEPAQRRIWVKASNRWVVVQP